MILQLFNLVYLHSNVQVKSKHTICKCVNEVLLLRRKTFLGAIEKVMQIYWKLKLVRVNLFTFLKIML